MQAYFKRESSRSGVLVAKSIELRKYSEMNQEILVFLVFNNQQCFPKGRGLFQCLLIGCIV